MNPNFKFNISSEYKLSMIKVVPFSRKQNDLKVWSKILLECSREKRYKKIIKENETVPDDSKEFS